MSGRGPSYNRTGLKLRGRVLRGAAVYRFFGKDGGWHCFTTTTTMRWLPAALRKGGLV
jgi:hypothetical protein